LRDSSSDMQAVSHLQPTDMLYQQQQCMRQQHHMHGSCKTCMQVVRGVVEAL